MSTTTNTTSLSDILLIGATGRTGRLVLESALTRGYKTLEDQNAVDKLIKESGMVFVMPRPAMLKGDTALSVKILGDAGEKSGFMPSVSAKSVAEFILDATVSQEWDGRTPVLAN
ncbi:hypothetical protein D6C81_01666 [Aureobasidium pullulans]|nr:hypothetical protein D6C81_01666 [Aureobasidium pullulans]